MFTVIIFVIILGLLVFVHELGHFLIARRNRVAVEEFGFGFPPRIFGFYKNKRGRGRLVWGSRKMEEIGGTVYSVNWIPLGGFVKITGEDGEEKNNPGSFSAKPPFARARILAAGVAMNFLLAAVLFSFGFARGVPMVAEEATGGSVRSEKIQVLDVGKNTPAETMGLRAGDEILGVIGSDGNPIKFSSVEEIQNYMKANEGNKVDLAVQRGKERLNLSGTPRADFPQGEGPLGIALAKTVEVSFPWYEAIWKGVQYTFDITVTFVTFLVGLIWRLISGRPVGIDVSGPVGIAVLTGQVAQLGFDYLIRFTAMLSVNLAIINILPVPALDGGRILFVLIEKFKGSPVSRKLEQKFHNVGFALLITLMIFVTARDFVRFDLIEKIRNLF